MNPNEISILSDDLRPRDTPNHTLLKDFVLKPMVPDLSITEEPRSEEPLFQNRCQQPVVTEGNTNVPSRLKPLRDECKTYSEWKKKSAHNSKGHSTNTLTQDNSYGVYVNGVSNPCVLDNLNSSVAQQITKGYSGNSPSSRPVAVNDREPQINGTGLSALQSTKRNQSHENSYSNWGEVHRFSSTEEAALGFDRHPKVTSRKSGHTLNDSINHYSGNSHKHFVNSHPDTQNCNGCVRWPHHPVPTYSCNNTPACNPYPHVRMPPCSSMPVRSSALTVSSPKMRDSPRHQDHSHNDSVIYDNLYQIVLSQSDQLKSLQAQVEKLLISQENHNCSNHSGRANFSRSNSTVVERGTQTCDGELNSEEGNKMSIGVMTSFIRTVAYTGRVELVDSRGKALNQPNRNMALDTRNKMQNGHNQSTSTSPPSSAPIISSASSRSGSPSPKSRGKKSHCDCHDCVDSNKKTIRKKQKNISDRMTQLDRLEEDFGRKGPGVSTAIRTVRGCQAALQNESNPMAVSTGRSDIGAGVDESITLNGVDLPTVVEQPVSPPSSIHVDMQDYHGSSSEEDGSSSDDEMSSSSESDASQAERRPSNGWNYYNNVLGQGNHVRPNKGTVSPDGDCVQDCCTEKVKGLKNRAERENLPPRSTEPQVSSVLKRVAFQHEPKPKEDYSTENLKHLALKYLRENYPEELASSGGYHPESKSSTSHKQIQEKALYNTGNNMSIATFHYLERYNLLPDSLNMNRIEEIPNYDDDLPANLDRAAHLNRSPMRDQMGARLQQINSGQYGMRVNGNDYTSKDRGARQNLPPLRERNKASRDSPGRKQSSKGRHKRHVQKTNPAPQSAPTNQQGMSTCKILDITALRQQPKLL